MTVKNIVDERGLVTEISREPATDNRFIVGSNVFEVHEQTTMDAYSSSPFQQYIVQNSFVVVETNVELILPELNANNVGTHIRIIAGRSFGDGFGNDRFRLSASCDIANTDDGTTGPWWTAVIPYSSPPGGQVNFGDVFDLYGFAEEYTFGSGSPKYWWTIVSSSNFMFGTITSGGENAP